VGWSHTALSGLLRNKEVVVALVRVAVLDESGINDGTWRWVLNCSSVSALNEHPLVDALVHDNKGDWRDSSNLVVQWLQALLELLDLLVDDLGAHSFANSISEDHNLAWHVSIVLLRKGFDGVNEASVEVLLHNLLELWLDDDV